MGTNLPMRCSQWHPTSGNDPHKTHPSHMTIAGHRVLTSYEGQPLTCYGCGAIGHMYHACPNKRGKNKDLNTRITTYAAIAAHGTPSRTESPENRTEPKPRNRRKWRRKQLWKQTSRHRQTTHTWVTTQQINKHTNIKGCLSKATAPKYQPDSRQKDKI